MENESVTLSFKVTLLLFGLNPRAMMHAKNQFFLKLSITNFKKFVFQDYETFEFLRFTPMLKTEVVKSVLCKKKSGRKENLIKQT